MIKQYLDEIRKEFENHLTTEHSYRPALKNLIQSLYPSLLAVNEPTRQKCGAPDYVILRNHNQIGYFECKDIDVNLDNIEKSDQMDRYRKSLDNLILTNHLEFRYYVNGQKIDSIQVAILDNGKIKYIPNHYEKLLSIMNTFVNRKPQPIKSSKKLSEIMAQKSVLIKQTTINLLQSVEEPSKHLTNLLDYFKKVLIHDLDVESFADMYAQTIAYGLFVARLNDTTLDTFSRGEARELVSKNNRFLRDLFDYISGTKLDEDLIWIVDDLVDVFKNTDIISIIKKEQKPNVEDVFLHFYETYLEDFDKEVKKDKGVYYTKLPIVKFIVNSVDEILRTKLGIKGGLSNDEKINYKYEEEGQKKEDYLYKVQILDPATGTGTFLVETIKKIYESFINQKGLWNDWVKTSLIPRLNGFEVMMTPYVMCHLKLNMALEDSACEKSNNRFNVCLTNALEKDTRVINLFAEFLTEEAIYANTIKNRTPIMVIIGNPPYKGESANGCLYNDELEEYKLEPNTKGTNKKPLKLKEKNPKWLNDDYVKFIRLAQKYIEKNNEGIIGYINPHSYLDNRSFRGMRYSLLKTFDEIYILNLHGNSNKGHFLEKDENVFNIKQGVCINIFVKTGKKDKSELAKVYYKDLVGSRDTKFDYLLNNSTFTVDFQEIKPVKPYYFLLPKNLNNADSYNKYTSINDIFNIFSNGVITARDPLCIKNTAKEVLLTVNKFANMETEDARTYFNLRKDVRDWKVHLAQNDLKETGLNEKHIVPIAYRAFDTRYTYYTGKNCGFHCNPRREVMQHLLNRDNIGLSVCKQMKAFDTWQHCFISNKIMDSTFVSNKTSETTSIFPLYIYPINQENSLFKINKIANIQESYIAKLSKKLKLSYKIEKEITDTKSFSPEDIINYIYAILYSNKYREKYNELLKTDFPKIPLPKNAGYFFKMAELGEKLIKYHLLKGIDRADFITDYPNSGNHEVKYIVYENNSVNINENEYFGNISEEVYNFKIGAYNPARNWLKDRKGKFLSSDDLIHYQKMIVAISKTIEIMEEIDKVIEL